MKQDRVFMKMLRQAYGEHLKSFLLEDEDEKKSKDKPKKPKPVKAKHSAQLKHANGLTLKTDDGNEFVHKGMTSDGKSLYIELPDGTKKKIPLTALEELGVTI